MELSEIIANFDILIAGTEPITEQVLARAQQLKLISRVGIGLESVDLLAARRRRAPQLHHTGAGRQIPGDSG